MGMGHVSVDRESDVKNRKADGRNCRPSLSLAQRPKIKRRFRARSHYDQPRSLTYFRPRIRLIARLFARILPLKGRETHFDCSGGQFVASCSALEDPAVELAGKRRLI